MLMLNSQRIEGYCAEGSGGQYNIVLPIYNMIVAFTSESYWNEPQLTNQPIEMLQQFILPAVN
jgi:hypothetical protein